MELPKDVLALEPYMKEANHLVDVVITKALAIHGEHLNRGNSRHGQMNDSIMSDSQASLSKSCKSASDIEWLNAEDFTIEAGERKINEFVETWNRDDSWLYCIDFLGQEEYECDHRYRYRVMWSIPTRRKPIPRATASVYFTIKISKFKPKAFPVDVYYVFETSSLVHRPGQSTFQQKWLKDIISSKVNLMTEIKF